MAITPSNKKLPLFLTAQLVLALLLIIPTLILLNHTGLDDVSISEWIPQTWLVKFWNWPGLSQKVSRIMTDVLLFFGIGVWGFFYIKGASYFENNETVSKKQLLLWLSVLLLILIFVIPFHSRDIYGYINRGAQQAFYAVNPYLIPLGEMTNWQSDPIFQNHWVNNPCPYGFFMTWILTQRILASIHFGKRRLCVSMR